MNKIPDFMKRIESVQSDALPPPAAHVLTKSKTIVENHEDLLRSIYAQADVFEMTYGHRNFSKSYWVYNVFSLVGLDINMYNLFREVRDVVRTVIPDGRPLWIQSWLNMQSQDQVLDWHIHATKWHGYISIDPKNTETVFETFKIKNEIGNIYFDTTKEAHKVNVIEPYPDFRITFGFDVTDEIKDYSDITDNRTNLGFIPIY
jgi:hypothetical protein